MTDGYSLWLMPSGDAYNKLKELAFQLSEKNSSPNFEPHVTLLGDIFLSEEEILDKTSKLATLIQPFVVSLNKVDYLDEYFRCLFIRAQETKDLAEANVKAREIFNRQQDPKFMPHLSIMYGNFNPAVKEKIISEIGREIKTEFEIKSIYLVAASSKIEPKDWKIIKEFSLK